LIFEYFQTSTQNIQLSLNSARTTGTSHENVRTNVTVSRLILLKIKGVRQKLQREFTHICMSIILFAKIRAVYEMSKNAVEPEKRRRQNTAHSQCMLDN
jgi:hypothetical protein